MLEFMKRFNKLGAILILIMWSLMAAAIVYT